MIHMILLLLFVAATILLPVAEAEVDATVEMQLSMHQYSWPDPKDKLCIVTRNKMAGSTLKLAECDDPKQTSTKNWVVDGKYLRLHSKPELCVEVPGVTAKAKLRLGECKKTPRTQQWLHAFNDDSQKGSQDFSIVPNGNRDSLYVMYGGSGSMASRGDSVLLSDFVATNKDSLPVGAVDWSFKQVQEDGADEEAWKKLTGTKCKKR